MVRRSYSVRTNTDNTYYHEIRQNVTTQALNHGGHLAFLIAISRSLTTMTQCSMNHRTFIE